MKALGKVNRFMTELSFNIIFSIVLLPANFCCSFWIFREVLNLAGITFREFLNTPHVPFGSGRFGLKRRQRFIYRFFNERSSEPEKSRKLLNLYGVSTLPGLAALILAGYGAMSNHLDKVKIVFIGNLILMLINIGLVFAGRIYRRNHPLDEKTTEILEAKRIKEKEKGGESRKKNIIVYAVVGAFFMAVLIGFNLGIAGVLSNIQSISGGKEVADTKSISFDDVNTVLLEKGFETANVPTTYWFYDENKLVNVTAGIKGNIKFEFYEYTDGETTDGVYNSISYNISQGMEFSGRTEHETDLAGGGKMFTVTQNRVYSLVLYKNNTVIYAHSPKTSNKIHEVLTQIGYLP